MIRNFTALLMSILWPLVLLVFFWVVLLFDETYNLHLNAFGVKPREIIGLLGIITSPFCMEMRAIYFQIQFHF